MLELVPLLSLAIAAGGPAADVPPGHGAPQECYVGGTRCAVPCHQFVALGDMGECDPYPSHTPRTIPLR